MGLLGGLGSFVVRRLARMRPSIIWAANPRMELAFIVAFLGGFGLFVGDPTLPVALRVSAEGMAWLLCARGNPYVAPFGAFAAASLALTTHAADAGARFADVLHVLSAAMWAGGVLVLATLRPPDGWGGAEAKTLLERFGRVAVIAFGVTALTGLLRATEQLRDISDLWTTPYGVVLVVKVAGVLAMLGLSVVWRRGRPAARADAIVTVAVVAATAFLAVLPSPA